MPTKNFEKLLVTYRDLRELGITLSREHIGRLCRQGRFPRPIRLGSDDQSTRSYWRYQDILTWVDERAEVSSALPTQRGNLPPARPSTRQTDSQAPKPLPLPAPMTGAGREDYTGTTP
jgi:predicted DNA-binding transcriptional regulator AlpA